MSRDRLDEVAIDARGCAFCGECADRREMAEPRASATVRGVDAQDGVVCERCQRPFRATCRVRVLELDNDVRAPDGGYRSCPILGCCARSHA